MAPSTPASTDDFQLSTTTADTKSSEQVRTKSTKCAKGESRDSIQGTLRQQQDPLSSNVALHSSHLKRRDLDATLPQKYPSCPNCQADQCPSHSDLHHLMTPQYVHRKLSFLDAAQNNVFACNGERKPEEANCLFMGNRR